MDDNTLDMEYFWQSILETWTGVVCPAFWNHREEIGRLVLAALLGGLVGIERLHHGRSAGFRTQLLVGLGTCLVMLVSIHFSELFGNRPGLPNVQVDPARVAYGVMAGVGFLGAGAILLRGQGVRGLTTAASLWCTAAVGLACGLGMYFVAAGATALVLFALVVLVWIDEHIPTDWSKYVLVTLPARPNDTNIPALRKLLTEAGANVKDIDYSRDFGQNTEAISMFVHMPAHRNEQDIIQAVSKIEGLQRIDLKWSLQDTDPAHG
jgi:putative Mg2+ transporter-C (MgtC) family protein